MEENLNQPTSLWIKLLLALLISANGLLVFTCIVADRDIRGEENNVMFSIQQAMQANQNLYTDPEEIPFSITQYSPLYYVLADWANSSLGVQPEEYVKVRIVSRLLSLFILLLTAYFFYQILRKHFHIDKTFSRLLALLLIVFTVPWYILSRPDVLVAFFLIISLFFFLSHIRNPHPLYMVLTGLMTFLAIFSKQNGIFWALIYIPLLGWYRDFKHLGFYLAGLGAGLLLSIGLLALFGYDSGHISSNAIDGINNGFDIINVLVKTWSNFYISFGTFLLVSFLIIGWLLKGLKKANRPLIVLLAFFSLQFCFAVVTSLKTGSGMNYFNESLMLLLLLWGWFYKEFNPEKHQIPVRFILIYFLIACGTTVTVANAQKYLVGNLVRIKHQMHSDPDQEAVIALMEKELDGNYFYSKELFLNLKMPNRCILPQSPIVKTNQPRGIFDNSKLCHHLHEGKVKFIITMETLPNELFGCSLSEDFSLYREIGIYKISKGNRFMS